MAQKTIKIPIEPLKNCLLQIILKEKGFEFKNHQHAYFRAQNGNVTVIFFRNQNFMIQGDEEKVDELFYFLREKLTLKRVEVGTLGLDESGKGDLFGPLVLAGAIIKDDDGFIEQIGVDDSKNISDEKIKRIFELLDERIIYKVSVIEPSRYNKLYEKVKNLNKLMISEYKNLITQFDGGSYNKIVLDKFSLSFEQIKEMKSGINKPIEIYEKAEKNPCVALASIVARYYFLEWFEKRGLPIIKGCGDKAIQFRRTLNSLELADLTKLHFKLDI